MANRIWDSVETNQRGVVILFAKVDFVSGTPSLNTSAKNWGVSSVTKTDTGDFQLNLVDKYPHTLFSSFFLESTTRADIRFQQKGTSTEALSFLTLTAGTETDPPDCTVSCMMVFKNTARR